MTQNTPYGGSADLTSFGPPIEQYKTESEFLNGLKYAGIAVLAAIAQAAVLFFFDTYYPILAILTPVLLVGALIMAVVGLIKGRRTLKVFAEGMAEVGRNKATVMPWNDIVWLMERVTAERGNKPKYKRVYIACDKNNMRLVLKDYERMDKMGATIFDEVDKRLEPRYTRMYEADETLNFGNIGVSKAGIDFGKGPIAWGEIEEISLVMNKVAVRRSGQRMDVSDNTIFDTPNFSLLRRMLAKNVPATKMTIG